MKLNAPKRFILHVLLYSTIVIVLYLLYSPLNSHPKNKTGSSTQFVYQQF